MYSIQRAMEFAANAHKGQTRKGSGKPYITHPVKVYEILRDADMPMDLLMAALNHDVVEDTDYTLEDIRNEFGDQVAHYVSFNTEDKSKSWEERKNHTIEQLKTATLFERALVVADKYANLLELIEQSEKKPDEDLWKVFKRGKMEQKWYFSGVAKSAMENLSLDEIPAFFHQYNQAVNSFFGKL